MLPTCEQGLIVDIHLTNSDKNSFKKFVECDVLLFSKWTVLYNVILATGFPSVDNGVFMLPSAATDFQTIDTSSPEQAYRDVLNSDGDWCIVDYFNNGRAFVRSIIPRVIPGSNPGQWNSTDGTKYLKMYFNGLTIQIAENKEVTISDGADIDIKITSTGSVEVKGNTYRLATEEIVNKVKNFITIYNTHQHPESGGGTTFAPLTTVLSPTNSIANKIKTGDVSS